MKMRVQKMLSEDIEEKTGQHRSVRFHPISHETMSLAGKRTIYQDAHASFED